MFKCEDGVPAVVNQIDFNDVVTEISVVHILSWKIRKMNIDNMNMKKDALMLLIQIESPVLYKMLVNENN